MNRRETERLRERALFLYSCALDAGDAKAIENVLSLAEEDPTLAGMLTEVETVYADAQQQETDTSAMARVQDLLSEHLASAYITENEEEDVPPLTVGDVAGQIKTEVGFGQVAVEAARVAQMQAARTPLPQDLTKAGVRRFFEQLGIAISRAFADRFRNIGIEMQMRQDRQKMRLAATRKQSNSRTPADPLQKQGPEQEEPETPA